MRGKNAETSPIPPRLADLHILGIHYLASLKSNEPRTMKAAAKAMNMPESTANDHWARLEAHFGGPLFVMDGSGRTGRLNPLGQMAGALAAHYLTFDYLIRNGGEVAALGEDWAREFKSETARMIQFATQMFFLMDKSIEQTYARPVPKKAIKAEADDSSETKLDPSKQRWRRRSGGAPGA